MIEITDIKDILDIERSANAEALKDSILGTNDKVKKNIFQPNARTSKRPEGMAREVFALLYNDSKDAPPLLPTDTDQGYKHVKAKLGMRRVRQWKWVPFTNPARKDQATFYHWKRVVDDGKEYPFAKFNKRVEVPKYTDEEYKRLLQDDNWSREETDHLFDLCERFDLRFIVIQDRYDRKRFKNRSVEDIKERYYTIATKLARSRHIPGTPFQEPKYFDADHERRRKEQLQKLFERTPAQVEEEHALIQELRKIEIRKREREKKAQDLQKLITGAEKEEKKQERRSVTRKRTATQTRQARAEANFSDIVGIKFPEQKTSGATTRSSRMKLPPGVGQKKTKLIDQRLQELDIESNPIPTEEICSLYNELRSDIVVANELKNALTTCVFEIQTYKHQYEAFTPHSTLEIPDIIIIKNE